MNNFKVFVAGMLTVSSLAFGTTGFADEGRLVAGEACDGPDQIDRVFEGGRWGCLEKVRQDNGWGNGDDDAPGESLENNNAENSTDGTCHAIHGCAKPEPVAGN